MARTKQALAVAKVVEGAAVARTQQVLVVAREVEEAVVARTQRVLVVAKEVEEVVVAKMREEGPPNWMGKGGLQSAGHRS